ncbi:membrane protein [Gordonia phage Neville]|uniref:Uncharacterized protein n=2 Tax=Nevillevirus TaxID=3044773 RepID=A0A515MGY2_9CAUD|nr:membrane protein [Gordonia phage Neville]YP_010246031.1 hypothetical protein L3Y20_gp046 [Gordonia phage Trax]AXQ64503.1 membrane protein [Gordonia phage Neville]QDM55933.1 hypothetical protein SEA_TRAX_46 [Gordonia phage Trax]
MRDKLEVAFAYLCGVCIFGIAFYSLIGGAA